MEGANLKERASGRKRSRNVDTLCQPKRLGTTFLCTYVPFFICLFRLGAPAVVLSWVRFFTTNLHVINAMSTRWTRPEMCRITRIGHGREPGQTCPSPTVNTDNQAERASPLLTCQSFTATAKGYGSRLCFIEEREVALQY